MINKGDICSLFLFAVMHVFSFEHLVVDSDAMTEIQKQWREVDSDVDEGDSKKHGGNFFFAFF